MIGGVENTPSYIIAAIFVLLVGWTLSVGNATMRIAMHAGMNKQQDLVPDEKTWVRSATHNELSFAMLHLALENRSKERKQGATNPQAEGCQRLEALAKHRGDGLPTDSDTSLRCPLSHTEPPPASAIGKGLEAVRSDRH